MQSLTSSGSLDDDLVDRAQSPNIAQKAGAGVRHLADPAPLPTDGNLVAGATNPYELAAGVAMGVILPALVFLAFRVAAMSSPLKRPVVHPARRGYWGVLFPCLGRATLLSAAFDNGALFPIGGA